MSLNLFKLHRESFKLGDRKVVGLERLLKTFYFEIEYIIFVFIQSFSKICKISSVRCFAVSQEFSVAHVCKSLEAFKICFVAKWPALFVLNWYSPSSFCLQIWVLGDFLQYLPFFLWVWFFLGCSKNSLLGCMIVSCQLVTQP